MLKITKGLKKKKKGKKGKHKEEELFEEAELEQYRKEQEEKRKQQAEAGEGEASEAGAQAKGEEWERFKALTSGVDSVLKKTQGDLDRIKSTSYFQRKPTPSELAAEKEQAPSTETASTREKSKKKDKKWVGFEDGTVDRTDQDEEPEEDDGIPTVSVVEPENTENQENLEDLNRHEEEEEEDDLQSDDEEDIFDTSYVDAVASGEVKLAYIPDSPQEEEDGFDPFDTSIVDKVIKEEPAEKKKRELVSLGCAVDVLTGRVEKPTSVPSDIKQKRSPRRQRQQDLLLGSFDEGQDQEGDRSEQKPVETDEPFKTLLDDDPIDGEDIQVDLSINLAPIVRTASPLPLAENENHQHEQHQIQSILSEFDTVSNVDDPKPVALPNGLLEDDDLEDEFAVLAAESLTKEVVRVSPLTVQGLNQENESNVGEAIKPARPPPPSTKAFDIEDNPEDNYEDDPFDTTFASEILPGKYELKLIEEEILKDDTPIRSVPAVSIQLPKSTVPLRDPLAFDEHNLLDDDRIQQPLSFKHRDLLGGSTTDLSKITHDPIEPAPVTDKADQELSYCDPFDTSIVKDLVAPGKAELKFLEKELLAEDPVNAINSTVIVDDDFDPRAESPPRRKSIPRPEQLCLSGDKRQSLPKVVAFKVFSPEPLPDLLSAGDNDAGKAAKPLTPYYPEPKLLENKLSAESEQDPFDTSFVSSAPGKSELKLIESELVGSAPEPTQNLTRSISDIDFDPHVADPIVPAKPQVLVLHFKEEFKEEPQVVQNSDILSEDVEIDTKLHTPVVPKRIEEELALSYSDPFDTSIAQHILPGKAELKLLESELIDSNAGGSIKRSYTDPDFDPRVEPVETSVADQEKPPALDLTEGPLVDRVAEKPLTPLAATATATFTTQDEDDIDPFDTSCVGPLIPGKMELKLLESELIHN